MFRYSLRSAITLVCLTFLGVGTTTAASWPSLRGPRFDGSVEDAGAFAQGNEDISLAWKAPLGSGYSSVVVDQGRVVTMFASETVDLLAAFDTNSGEELWRYEIGETYNGHDGSHDGPISTPLIADGKIFGLGPWGQLFALDAATGAELWSTHLVEDHGANKPHYGFSTSPVIADGVLVVQVGAGEGKSVAGFEAASGKLLWSQGDGEIHYHSPIVAEIDGKTQILAATGTDLVSLDPASGEVFWSTRHGGDEAAMGGATIVPVPAGENRILLLNKIDSSVMLEVGHGTEGFEITELWSSNAMRGTYVIPVIHDGFIYGMTGRIFTCVDAATGETRWKSREPGDGFPTLVGDKLVIITKPGTLHVANASPEGYQEVARLDLFEEHSWSSVAFADGHIFARSMAHLARIDPSRADGDGEALTRLVANTQLGRFLTENSANPDLETAMEQYLEKQTSLPIVEPSGAVHFVYRGDARDVGIVGDMIGARREDPMTRIESTDFFYYTTFLEPNAAVTYGFIVDYEDPIADPENPRTASGLFGEVSWLAMPAWDGPAFDPETETASQGRLEILEWDSEVREGQKRTAQVYLPAGYTTETEHRYPVAYIHGGQQALGEGGAKQALDQLIGDRVEPLIAVFVIFDEENPRQDLGDWETYSDMIQKELVPTIDEKYRTRPDRLSRASVGSGRGAANAALLGALRHADTFGRVAVQSATLMAADQIAELVPHAADQPMVIYQEWGTYDLRSPHEAWNMANGNRQLWALLRERGYRPAGGEYPQGFGWSCWKSQTDDWLRALFPNAS